MQDWIVVFSLALFLCFDSKDYEQHVIDVTKCHDAVIEPLFRSHSFQIRPLRKVLYSTEFSLDSLPTRTNHKIPRALMLPRVLMLLRYFDTMRTGNCFLRWRERSWHWAVLSRGVTLLRVMRKRTHTVEQSVTKRSWHGALRIAVTSANKSRVRVVILRLSLTLLVQ